MMPTISYKTLKTIPTIGAVGAGVDRSHQKSIHSYE
tara:strand:- start:588 stop:695 length:108 start_codon:yes stop_codon:yes gene_type:complete